MCELTVTAALLGPLLDSDPAGPSITYYDDATGERIEVSHVTLANWAAKTGNLLRDELGAGPASRVAILLPAHWQTAAVLFGLWWIGAEALVGGPSDVDGADLALCTAGRIDEADAAAGMGEIAVLSLDPFGRPVPDLPVGVTDYATAVRVHGDQIVPERAPGPALNGRPVDEVLAAAGRAATAAGLQPRDRVLSTADWATADDVVEGLLAVYAVGGSLVQVAHPDPAVLERRRAMEKVTRDLC
ncbi:TIGR03089 family protein [Mycolicibacterium monacense]|uniref:TIGR03089 family protein n=1 Tax=Mycolicibacterium monacense TaxID=85693 RepID=A0AAD1N0H2_MYCMB|nr:TIGR03089 family protein [Mycolicibacterium monacense]OBB72835.1 TIGR03089 family protein [Mycolicibacterium monacense]ORB23392.1 TIGR03089 family protein [Mycolicibacterium monacense DSM 44395]QHP85145.1 TIGR03089 family protein [Mycolicibacterium monacense DSM 44395]BBZ62017.1 TIGR03089 family protein [Mycolicibacterium monacense]